ncbi:hypothetical protein BSLG_010466 [Batrachochytrium salamandrivorans]|nr:hypothetical protein BSLG_010466 [Batrachochytrium salamandrivorans]
MISSRGGSSSSNASKPSVRPKTATATGAFGRAGARPPLTRPAPVDKQKTLQKLVQASRSNGRLNISNQGLDRIPDSLWTGDGTGSSESSTVNVSFDRPSDEGNWWEVTDLSRLIAADNNITDIDPRIGELGALSILDLHNNTISMLPESIGSLQHLAILNLSFNRLSILPDAIFQLPLVELYLQGNTIKELPHTIGNLSRLSVLDLSDNNLTELPPSMASLSSLLKLNISKNKLTNLGAVDINGFIHLTELNAGYNTISSFVAPNVSAISLPKLKIFDLKNNRMGLLDVILDCPELCDLCLSFNQITSIAAGVFSNLVELQILDLRDNALSEVPIDVLQLAQLKRLDLTNNSIRLLQPQLGLLKNLSMLLVSGNPIRGLPATESTAKLLMYLQTRIPAQETPRAAIPGLSSTGEAKTAIPQNPTSSLAIASNSAAPTQQEVSSRIMNLSNQSLTALDEAILSGFSFSPSTIDLSQNQLQELPSILDQYSSSLSSLIVCKNRLLSFPTILFSHLKTLDLSCNNIASIPENLPSLPRLNELNLSFNQITLLPKRLSFPQLSVFLVCNNRISEIDAKALIESVPELQTLDLSNNSIQSIPPELALLPRMRSLQLQGNLFRVPRAAILQRGTDAILEYLKGRIPA